MFFPVFNLQWNLQQKYKIHYDAILTVHWSQN